ncbi:MAG: hypothetical protein ACF8PG_10780, partial [Maioricimonas sp. JB045]
KARDYLQQASSKEGGEDSTIYDHMGDCEQKLGDEEAARTAWKKALELETDKTSPDEEMLEKLRSKLGLDGDGKDESGTTASSDN